MHTSAGRQAGTQLQPQHLFLPLAAGRIKADLNAGSRLTLLQAGGALWGENKSRWKSGMWSNKRQSYLECLEAALDFRETSLTEGHRGFLLQFQHHSFCGGASGFKNLPPAIHSLEHLLVV